MRLVYRYPKFKAGSYTRCMKTLQNAFAFDSSDVAKFRLKVIEHYREHGWRSACDAYEIGRSTLYEWKKRLEESGGRLTALIPKSTRPHRTRRMEVDERLVGYIKELRQTYGNMGKERLKPLLDAYAESLGVKSYSSGKIGKIIKRYHLTFPGNKRKRKRKKRKRVKRSPKEKRPGYVELDSIIVYVNSKRINVICAIDVYTKLAYAKRVGSLSSLSALEVLQAYEERRGYHVHTVQTDNGSEFLASFDAYCQEKKIEHLFTYPRSPKINGVVERFNRTIQEEFIERCDSFWYDLSEADRKMEKYLSWYNDNRPHTSLGLLSPLNFYQSIPECM